MDFYRAKMTVAAMLAFSCAGSLVAPAAFGCAFHNTIPETKLEGMYPGSLSVAVALRKAADSGVIDPAALAAPRNVATLFLDTMPRLQDFRKFLAASHLAAELPASFTLGYVESGLWTRFTQSTGEIGIEIHIDGPAEGEAVVLTGEPVVADLLAGRLLIDHALADGMIHIDGNEREGAVIYQVLKSTDAATIIGRW